MKGQTTKERILSHALDLASAVGVEGLTLGGLAKVTAMSKSGLFAHFASKEELQVQVLAAAADDFVRTVVSPALRQPRGEPRVRALLENWLDWASRLTGGCPFMAAAFELDDRPPGPVRDALVAGQRDWVDTLATAIRIAVAEGHFRRDVDVDQLAFEIYGTYMAFHLYDRLLHHPSARQRTAAAVDRLLASARQS